VVGDPDVPVRAPRRRVLDQVRVAEQVILRERVKKTTTPEDAVARFLQAMSGVANRTFPEWRKRLVTEIEECCRDFEMRRTLLDMHPLDDYYFAGVVALEASRIRRLFHPMDGDELMSSIGSSISAVANRSDRLVPDVMFSIVARIAVSAGVDKFKRDYDQVGRVILERMGVDKAEPTKHLMRDIYYRHNLGEPLALGVPRWWKAFAERFELDRCR
jgi:hypothetical protein